MVFSWPRGSVGTEPARPGSASACPLERGEETTHIIIQVYRVNTHVKFH